MPVTLISLNIEGHRHLEPRVLPFLKERQADVICLQEVFEVDVPVLTAALDMSGRFIPQANVTTTSIHQQHALGNLGLLMMSKQPIINPQVQYYVGNAQHIPTFFKDNEPNSLNRALLWGSVEVDKMSYTIGTTHFTWSPKGEATPLQQENLDTLFTILDFIPEIILCGDFNAPRGRKTWQRLAARYQDNIPAEVETTLDGDFHKAGQIMYVVDGMFSTREYEVGPVEVVAGVSDHQAVVAQIHKKHD